MQRVAGSLCLAILCSVASGAHAVPITSYHTTFTDAAGNAVSGTITATLDLYTLPFVEQVGQPALAAQFDVGVGRDFTVYVPPAFVGATWEATIPGGNAAQDWVLAKDGLSGLAPYPIQDAVMTVDALGDGCGSGLNGTFVNGIFAMVRRGTCGFAEKVTAIEGDNGVGVLIVNWAPDVTDPSLPPAQHISLGTAPPPSIPVVFLSYAAGARILAQQQPGFGGLSDTILYLDFAARWDPDVVEVAEPSALSLLAAGLLLLVWGGRAGRLTASQAPARRI